MPSYPYLIVGGGMTGHAAAAAIRERDPESPIGLIGEEAQPPYARPPLTKGLWKGTSVDQIALAPVPGLSLHTGRRAIAIDRSARTVEDDHGAVYHYDKLLLATGGVPRRLPFGGDRLIAFRTLSDYERLRSLGTGKRVVVIGGGFIGSEISAALAMNGYQVTLVFPEEGIGARLFPAELVRFLNGYYREKGVDVRAGEQVEGIEPRDAGAVVRTGGAEFPADAVVAGVGIRPETTLAQAAGLSVEDGILVDEGLRTSDPAIFAAGDVARFPSAVLGKRIRVEHEDNANTQGRDAGRAMAGEPVSYTHVPFFYSDLFELGYEAVGEVDSRHQVVTDWKEPYREGFLYYLSEGRVRGVLCWGVFGQVDPARELLSARGPFRPEDLRGRLPR